VKDGGDDGGKFEDWNKDPYPPFPERLSPEAVTDRYTVTPPTVLDNIPIPAIPKISLPTPPISEVITVEDSGSDKRLDKGLLIGSAKPDCCRDPNVHPVARASFSSKGSLCVYIQSKYAKRETTTGHIQITLKDVDFFKKFEQIPAGEKRVAAIRHQLQAKLAAQRTEKTPVIDQEPTIDLTPDSVEQKITPSHPLQDEDEYPVIGRAKPHLCLDPKNPAIVYAMLNAVGAVVAFIPGQESVKRRKSGRSRISFENIEFSEDLASLGILRRSAVVKERILAMRKEFQGKEGRKHNEGVKKVEDEESRVNIKST
jgi:hypothetical protein